LIEVSMRAALRCLSLAGLACTPAVEQADDPVADALLAAVGPAVIEPAVAAAAAPFDALVATTEAWAASPADEGLRATAGEAWRAAFLAWQAVEVMQVGPAGSSLSVVAGQDLRDRIYSWPTVDRCGVDRQTVLGGWEVDGFAEALLIDRIGLDAIESLLMSPAGVHACAFSVDIARDGTWDALGVESVQARRAAYAATLASAARANLDALASAWSAEGGNFSATLGTPTEDNPVYDDREEALDALFRAMFYVETAVKELKVGRPSGRIACPAESCAGDAEAQLADASLEAIRVNLASFEGLYLGAEGVGFDDLLVDRGFGDVDAAMRAAIAGAKAAADAATLPMEDATGDPAATALYDALKVVTDLLKGDFATVLTLAIPSEAAGDND
jgi:predicted lipoprotein